MDQCYPGSSPAVTHLALLILLLMCPSILCGLTRPPRSCPQGALESWTAQPPETCPFLCTRGRRSVLVWNEPGQVPRLPQENRAYVITQRRNRTSKLCPAPASQHAGHKSGRWAVERPPRHRPTLPRQPQAGSQPGAGFVFKDVYIHLEES